MTWLVTVRTPTRHPSGRPTAGRAARLAVVARTRTFVDGRTGQPLSSRSWSASAVERAERVTGPAAVVEDDTTTHRACRMAGDPQRPWRSGPVEGDPMSRRSCDLSPPADLGPAHRDRRGAGPDAHPHGVQPVDARSRRPLGRRVRYARAGCWRRRSPGRPATSTPWLRRSGTSCAGFPAAAMDRGRRLRHERPVDRQRPPERLHRCFAGASRGDAPSPSSRRRSMSSTSAGTAPACRRATCTRKASTYR